MGESVSRIFKVLIKVPIIILVSFAVFNIFAFGLSYMKMLGLSYVVLQTGMENNYIPPTEEQTIKNYMSNSLETGVLTNVDFTPSTTYNKGQYGEPITVGVQAKYNFIWPLMPSQQINGKFQGMSNTNTFAGFKTDTELEQERQKLNTTNETNIKIEYTVPGLRYYSDLD